MTLKIIFAGQTIRQSVASLEPCFTLPHAVLLLLIGLLLLLLLTASLQNAAPVKLDIRRALLA